MSTNQDELPEIIVTARRPSSENARQPRGLVYLNGKMVPGWVSWEVTNNTYFEADTYRVEFAVSALPKSNNAAWFAAQKETFVEIHAGFPSNPDAPNPAELGPLIYGRVDDIGFDPVTTLITLTGRDLIGAFIDKKLTTQYTNQSSSSIVNKIIASHKGIYGNVTKTKGFVGTPDQNGKVVLQANRSEWDMICFLARHENFVAYMTGSYLYFGPDPIPTADPYKILWNAPDTAGGPPSANVIDLSFSRSQTISKGVSVTVLSYNHRAKQNISVSYPTAPKSIAPGKASPYGPTQQYYYTLPAGSDPDTCRDFAQARYKEIVSHEMKMKATLPGDLDLTTKMMISVSGTGTEFDQMYYPKSITREMSMDVGFTMSVEAQNQSPDLQSHNQPEGTGNE